MGEQHSKTSCQKQSTDCSSASSFASVSDKGDFQPITCSPEKFKQISKPRKIKTTCSLKSTQKELNLAQTLDQANEEKQFEKALKRIALKMKEREETDKKADLKDNETQNLSKQSKRNPDIDRIETIFSFEMINLNFNEFKPSQESFNNEISVKWTQSVNKIMLDTQEKYQYCQGHLLICAVMRLYLTESMTYLFLTALLGKVGYLISQPQEYLKFSEDLETQCVEKYPLLSEKLKDNELDFQFLFTGWVLGMFANVLPKESCMRVWLRLIESQNPEETLKNMIFECMKHYEKTVFSQGNDMQGLQKDGTEWFSYRKVAQIMNDYEIND